MYFCYLLKYNKFKRMYESKKGMIYIMLYNNNDDSLYNPCLE